MMALAQAVKAGADTPGHWQAVIEKFGAFLVDFHGVRREHSPAASPPRSAAGVKAFSPGVGGSLPQGGVEGLSGDLSEFSEKGA